MKSVKTKILCFLCATAMSVSMIPASLISATEGVVDWGSIHVDQVPMQTIYDEPASVWESQTLPIGNGFLGASVFGGVESEEILINEHTLWSGGPGANANYDGGIADNSDIDKKHDSLKYAREELATVLKNFSDNYTPGIGAANTMNYPGYSGDYWNAIETLKGERNNCGSYQELGRIKIDEQNPGEQNPDEELNFVITTNGNKDITPGESVDMIFDGAKDTKWYTLAGNPVEVTQEYPIWVQIETKTAYRIASYGIMSANDVDGRDPYEWKLMGSDDGTEWETLDHQSGVIFSQRHQEKMFPLSDISQYRYLRLEILSVKSPNSGLQIAELRFYDEAGNNILRGGDDEVENYRRSLDIDHATVSVSYSKDNVHYAREYFASNPGNFIAARLTVSDGAKMTKYIGFTTPQTKATVTSEGNTITITGWPADHVEEEKLLFAAQIKVVSDGEIASYEDYIAVTNASKIEIYMTAGTNYRQCMDDSFDYFSDEDPLDGVKARLAAIEGKSYEELKAVHIADYKELYDRVKIDLGGMELPSKMTDELLLGYKEKTNSKEENRYLETVYYQFGRYLLIASSREGSLPANLQGIWGEGLSMPWSADYHTNINIQMNYWLAEQTNLSECHQPLIDYINSLVARGSITANTYHYNVNDENAAVRGWVTYVENNVWGHTAPGTFDAGFYFPTAAAWLVQHIWEQYAFTMDEEILAENYETLKGAALFWVDNLVVDPRDGTLVASPSYSPEHGSYSLGASCDQAIIWELFNNTVKAASVLGDDSSEIEEIKNAMSKLSLPTIGVNKQYMEWKDEITLDVTGDNQHRHVNHLYALHPGTLVVAGRSEQDDLYIEAMKRTLKTRGDGGTGWSKAWKINFWARIRDDKRAGLMVQQIIKESTYDNLYDTHPPFQIDGNFGATAGITEMFLQSQGDSIDLLPAVPSMWFGSSISGICARGNVEVDIASTSKGALEKAVLQVGTANDALKVRAKNLADFVVCNSKGNKVDVSREDADTIIFAAEAGETYTIVRETDIPHVHTETILSEVSPTCTESGLSEGVCCSECSEILTAQSEIPALGHDWKEDANGFVKICERCGETEDIHIDSENNTTSQDKDKGCGSSLMSTTGVSMLLVSFICMIFISPKRETKKCVCGRIRRRCR